MHTNPDIFKAYDIRGIYEKDITTETAYRLGRVFARFLTERKSEGKPMTLVLARDMRDSGTTLQQEMEKGLQAEGVRIIDIGMVSTPTFYYATLEYQADGGVIITASHNPAEYNGFKLVRENAIPISGDNGMYEIRDRVMEESVSVESDKTEEKAEKEEKPDTLARYVEHMLAHRNAQRPIEPLNIVVDTANGMGALDIKEFFDRISDVTYTHLYPELDGTFPNHEANPLKEETLTDLKAKVREENADFGIATDGDFDRVAFVDNEGNTIRPDIAGALLVSALLEDYQGMPVLYDLRSSNVLPEKISEAGGEPVMTRVGHSFIKDQMRERSALVAIEFSGHFYFDIKRHGAHAYFENPLLVMIKLMELLSSTGQSLAELTAPLFRYEHSGEINFEIKRNKAEVIEEVKQYFSEGTVNEMDGVRIDHGRFWLLVRASNTEPVVRLIVEATDRDTMEQVIQEAREIITR